MLALIEGGANFWIIVRKYYLDKNSFKKKSLVYFILIVQISSRSFVLFWKKLKLKVNNEPKKKKNGQKGSKGVEGLASFAVPLARCPLRSFWPFLPFFIFRSLFFVLVHSLSLLRFPLLILSERSLFKRTKYAK